MTFNKSWGDGGRSVIMGTRLPSLILHPLYPLLMLLVGRCYLSIIVPEGTPFCCDTSPQQMWAVRFVAEPLNSWQRHFHKNLRTWANPNFHQVYPYIGSRGLSLAVSTTFGDFILSQELRDWTWKSVLVVHFLSDQGCTHTSAPSWRFMDFTFQTRFGFVVDIVWLYISKSCASRFA